MTTNNFFHQFKNDYAMFLNNLSQGLIKFELPFTQTGCNPILNDKKIVSFASNDYLNLIKRKDVLEVAKAAIDKYGTGCGSSMVGSGSLLIHRQLADELADFFNKEAGVIFPTGYGAMLGFCSANILNGARIYSDDRNHRSIIDGLKLGQGLIQDYSDQVVFFSHNSLKSLETKFNKKQSEPKTSNYDLLFVEGIYSMNGDQGDLHSFVPFCKKNNILTAIDDAHGVGVIGKNGRGTASHQNLLREVDFILGTFSKSFATTGGFLVGPKDAVEYIRLFCGSYMFSASLAPVSVEVTRHILNIIRNDNSLQEKLWSNINLLKNGLKQLGFDYGKSDSAVIPVYVRDTKKALELADRLLKRGFYVLAAIPPGVAQGEELIRISVNAGHTKENIEQFLDTLDTEAKNLQITQTVYGEK